MTTAFEKEYRINIIDVDTKHQCKFSSLINYLWDVVISQSDSLGETKDGLIHNNCVWALLKYNLKMYEYPKFKDVITVNTKVL